MTRSILLGIAAAMALATTPSLAAPGENWEQASRAYAAYAFGNPAAASSAAGVDALATGSIGHEDAVRVQVDPFCEGAGKMIVERLNLSYCDLSR